MSLNPSVGLSLLFVILGSVGAESRAGDSAAESALKAKGLTKTGHSPSLTDLAAYGYYQPHIDARLGSVVGP